MSYSFDKNFTIYSYHSLFSLRPLFSLPFTHMIKILNSCVDITHSCHRSTFTWNHVPSFPPTYTCLTLLIKTLHPISISSSKEHLYLLVICFLQSHKVLIQILFLLSFSHTDSSKWTHYSTHPLPLLKLCFSPCLKLSAYHHPLDYFSPIQHTKYNQQTINFVIWTLTFVTLAFTL